MGAFGSIIAGAGKAAGEIGAQQRDINAKRNLAMLQMWENARNHYADLLAQRMTQVGGGARADIADTLKRVYSARPGDDLGKLFGDVQAHTQVHPGTVDAMQNGGLIPGPQPPAQPSPAGPGQVQGTVGGNKPSSLPSSSPVSPSMQTPQGIDPGFSRPIPPGAGSDPGLVRNQPPNNFGSDPGLVRQLPSSSASSLAQPSMGASPSPVPLISPPSSAGGGMNSSLQPSPYEKTYLDLEDNYMRTGDGYVPPWLTSITQPIRQKLAAFQEETQKNNVIRSQRKQWLQDSGLIGKIPPGVQEDYLSTGKLPGAGTLLKPGEVLTDATGSNYAYGAPRLETTPEGAVTNMVPTAPPTTTPGPVTPGPGSPTQAGPISGIQQIAAPPPKLTGTEPLLVSAAQQVAEKYGLPFNRDLNPRNPLAQIPTQYHPEVNALFASQKMDPEVKSSLLAMRSSTEALRNAMTGNALLARSDRSYQESQKELDAYAKPVNDRAERISRLQDTLAQGTPAAFAEVAPELVTTIAGGMGSGVRITQPEINSTIGGRSGWENIKAAVQHWKLNPKEALQFTPSQVSQMESLLKVVSDKIYAKQDALTNTYRSLATSTNPSEQRLLVSGARDKLAAIDRGTQAGPVSPVAGDEDAKIKAILAKHK